jgi:hypothetical protein
MLYAGCSGLFRRSLWLGQIGPPTVSESMQLWALTNDQAEVAFRSRAGVELVQHRLDGVGGGGIHLPALILQRPAA